MGRSSTTCDITKHDRGHYPDDVESEIEKKGIGDRDVAELTHKDSDNHRLKRRKRTSSDDSNDSYDDDDSYSKREHSKHKNKKDRHKERKDKKARDRSKREHHSESKKTKKADRHGTHDHDHRNDTDDRNHKVAKKRKRHDDDKLKKVKKEKSSHRDLIKENDVQLGKIKKGHQQQRPHVDKSKLYSLGDVRGKPPDVLLDAENDYYAQNQHFRLYLYREKGGLIFDELSSKDARILFQQFVHEYNIGALEVGYYTTSVPIIEAMKEIPSTRHHWGMKITHNDTQNLRIIQEGVRKQTEYEVTTITSNGSTSSVNNDQAPYNNPLNNNTTASLDDPSIKPDTIIDHQQQRYNNRIVNRRLREHVQTTYDELTGSGGIKDGHERMIEKRQERAAKIHGAAKYNIHDMASVELDDTAIYGGSLTDTGGTGQDEYQRLLHKSKQRTESKEVQKQARLVELQQKEQEKQNAMLVMLGLSHKIGEKKIIIPPRK